MKTKIPTIILIIAVVTALSTVTWVYAYTQTKYSPNNHYTPTSQVNWEVEHSVDGLGWNTIDVSGSNPEWFCRVKTTSAGYSGSAVVTWQLQKSADGVTGWTNIGSLIATNAVFDGTTGQYVYATSDGTVTGNVDWQDSFTGEGYYRVAVTLTY